MDKRQFKNYLLASTLLSSLDRIKDTVQNHPVPVIETKPDGTPVTQLDLALSRLIEEAASSHFPEVIFYSEEKYSDWGFPLLALDPLDGTREYIEQRPEWAISVGLFSDENFSGEGWVFNPVTNELFERGIRREAGDKSVYVGEVSRSEWQSGLFNKTYSERFKLSPIGSIAYKLGRLSQGKSDFVVSLRAKNIWDVAGGTLLCQEAGIKFYAGGKLVTKVEKSYAPPLIWCHEELFSELSALFG